MKSILAAVFAAPFLATSAIAGPYVDGGLDIYTVNGSSDTQTYVVVGGYEQELTDGVVAYVEAGGGAGTLGSGDSEGVIRAAVGVDADLSESVSLVGRYEFNEFQNSEIGTNRYTANIRYTF